MEEETKTYKVTLFTVSENRLYQLREKVIEGVKYFRFGGDTPLNTHSQDTSTDTRAFFYNAEHEVIFAISCYKPDLLEIEKIKG